MKQNVKNLNIIALSLKIKSTSWKDITVFDSVNVFLALQILEIRSFKCKVLSQVYLCTVTSALEGQLPVRMLAQNKVKPSIYLNALIITKLYIVPLTEKYSQNIQETIYPNTIYTKSSLWMQDWSQRLCSNHIFCSFWQNYVLTRCFILRPKTFGTTDEGNKETPQLMGFWKKSSNAGGLRILDNRER